MRDRYILLRYNELRGSLSHSSDVSVNFELERTLCVSVYRREIYECARECLFILISFEIGARLAVCELELWAPSNLSRVCYNPMERRRRWWRRESVKNSHSSNLRTSSALRIGWIILFNTLDSTSNEPRRSDGSKSCKIDATQRFFLTFQRSTQCWLLSPYLSLALFEMSNCYVCSMWAWKRWKMDDSSR